MDQRLRRRGGGVRRGAEPRLPAKQKSNAALIIVTVCVLVGCVVGFFAWKFEGQVSEQHERNAKFFKESREQTIQHNLRQEAGRIRPKMDHSEWKNWCIKHGLTLCKACLAGDPDCARCLGRGLE